MRIVIAGGHGQIARHLSRALAARGDSPVGLVRNPAHTADVEDDGAVSSVLDLEQASVSDVTRLLEGAEAVVFAAGAGPGSGAARKESVDRAAAVLLADAAQEAGVRRYLMVSAMGVERADPDSGDVYQVYLRAKAAADKEVRARDLDWTIVRPGRLTDEPGTGLVQIGSELPRGAVPRADVAAVLAACLTTPASVRKTFDLLSGSTPIETALAGL